MNTFDLLSIPRDLTIVILQQLSVIDISQFLCTSRDIRNKITDIINTQNDCTNSPFLKDEHEIKTIPHLISYARAHNSILFKIAHISIEMELQTYISSPHHQYISHENKKCVSLIIPISFDNHLKMVPLFTDKNKPLFDNLKCVKYNQRMYDVIETTIFSGVHSLHVNCNMFKSKQLRELMHLRELYIPNSMCVKSVAMLGDLHVLDISYCMRVRDVSALGRVHKLNISYTRVRDVKALANVYELDISHCNLITDVNVLTGVKKLICRNLDSYISVHGLKNIPSLNLHNSRNILNAHSLGNNELLILGLVPSVSEASIFKRVKVLDLSGTSITDVSALGDVYDLNISFTEVSDVSALGRVHKLDLSSCYKINDFSMLGNVHTLILKSTNITDVSALVNVHTLDLSFTHVIDVSPLINVHNLSLFASFKFYGLGLKNLVSVRELNLSGTRTLDLNCINCTNLHTLNLTHCKYIKRFCTFKDTHIHTLILDDVDVPNIDDYKHIKNISFKKQVLPKKI